MNNITPSCQILLFFVILIISFLSLKKDNFGTIKLFVPPAPAVIKSNYSEIKCPEFLITGDTKVMSPDNIIHCTSTMHRESSLLKCCRCQYILYSSQGNTGNQMSEYASLFGYAKLLKYEARITKVVDVYITLLHRHLHLMLIFREQTDF